MFRAPGWLRLFVICLLLLLFAGSTAAQEDVASTQDEMPLDPNAVPDHGIAAGAVGFSPDPFRVQSITGGGEINAVSRNLGTDCFGMIKVQPDFRFTALGEFEALRFVFVADTVTSDASLIIRDANGNYWCNNNSYGVFHPTITIAPAPAGDYNVWVGSLSTRVMGDLYVTTRLDVTPSSTGLVVPRPTAVIPGIPTPTPIPPGMLNFTVPPRFGTETLTAGFLPDPYWIALFGGGSLNVETMGLGSDCAGFTGSIPALTLNWSGVSTRLRFLFAETIAGSNPALIVRDPNGIWSCNRDFAGWITRPQVEFINPAVGAYHIWVSNELAADAAVVGLLYVTEKTYTPDAVGTAGTERTAPLSDLIPSASAFVFDANAPDPYAVPGSLGGGELNVGELNPDCPGYYTHMPSFGFTMPEPTLHLRAFFVQENDREDTALIVRMPDGTWYCNDDSYNGRQPTVDVIGNYSIGVVSIWVGSYDEGESIPGTIYITRGSANLRDPLRPPPLVETASS